MLLTIKSTEQPQVEIGQQVYAGTAGRGVVCGLRLTPKGTWEYLIRFGENDPDEIYYFASEMIILGCQAHLFWERWEIEAKPVNGGFAYQVRDKETGLQTGSLRAFDTPDDACIAAIKMLQREFWEDFGLDDPTR